MCREVEMREMEKDEKEKKSIKTTNKIKTDKRRRTIRVGRKSTNSVKRKEKAKEEHQLD